MALDIVGDTADPAGAGTAVLPEGWTKYRLLELVEEANILSPAEMRVLRRIARRTPPASYIDPDIEPICFERQETLAASLGITPRQWRRVEAALARKGVIRRDTALNGHRSSQGLGAVQVAAGLVLSPLIERLGELIARRGDLRAEQEALSSACLEAQILRRRIRDETDRLEGTPIAKRLMAERATWRTPRRMGGLEIVSKHVENLRTLLSETSLIESDAAEESGWEDIYDRCHITSTTDQPSDSCSAQVPSASADAEDDLERGAAATGDDHEFTSALALRQVLGLVGEDMRLYVDGLRDPGTPRTWGDLEQAAHHMLREMGISASAYIEAIEAMGPLRALLSLVVIDRNRTHPSTPIENPGGALRAFARRETEGALNLKGAIFGLWRRDGAGRRTRSS